MGHNGGGTIGAIRESEGIATCPAVATTVGAADVVGIAEGNAETGKMFTCGCGNGVTLTESALALCEGAESLDSMTCKKWLVKLDIISLRSDFFNVSD